MHVDTFVLHNPHIHLPHVPTIPLLYGTPNRVDKTEEEGGKGQQFGGELGTDLEILPGGETYGKSKEEQKSRPHDHEISCTLLNRYIDNRICI